jgi:hypothetical protein
MIEVDTLNFDQSWVDLFYPHDRFGVDVGSNDVCLNQKYRDVFQGCTASKRSQYPFSRVWEIIDENTFIGTEKSIV